MTDVLETELNNLIFRSQRAQAEFNAELGFVERLEQAANALREVRIEVMERMAGQSLPPPVPQAVQHPSVSWHGVGVDNFAEAYQPSSDWRQ